MVDRRVTGPDPVEIPHDRGVADLMWDRADAGDHLQILRFHDGTGWRGMTWVQLAERVEGVAGGLIALGVEHGDRVAIMSQTRVDWTIADLAIASVGAVSVPIYETSSVAQAAWVLSDSAAKVAFAADSDLAKILESCREEAPDLGEILVFDDGGLDTIAARASDQDRTAVRERARAVTTEDLFSLIYTSGTVGTPRGCMITHGNMLWTAAQAGVVLDELLAEEDSTLLFLPLAHVFARLIHYLFLGANVTVGFSRGRDRLTEDLAEFRPTFLLAVPRVFEKVFEGARRKATGVKRRTFEAAVRNALSWSEALDAGRRPAVATRLGHGLFDRLVHAKLRAALGGRVHHCVSGGAPLAPHLAHFFTAAGITVLEGYGLTETTAPATVNTPQRLRIGTVGVPLPGVEIGVADDGEVLVKGGNVFAGYFHDEQGTGSVLDPDGWLRTGDLGAIDADGFLRITGRKKDIIVTASGKNVAPAPLEEHLKQHALVSQAMVVGDGRPFVGALVTLDAEALEAFAAEHGITGDATRDERVRAEVDKAVAHANAAVSQAESIRDYVILERDFAQERDEVTPTLKVRRSHVAEHFADAIEALYAPSSG